MRWKLTFFVSLIASVVGAGLTLALMHALFGSARRPANYDPAAVAGTLLIPIIAVIAASIFVYRHTARRRRLQAMATAILTFLLTLTIFLVCSMLFSRQMPAPPSAVPPHIVS